MSSTMLPPVVDAAEPEVPGVDPRFRVRRLEVRRSARRRRRRIWWTVLAVVAVTGLSVGAVFSPLLGVSSETVVGNAHVRADRIRSVAGIRRGDAMVLIDTGGAEARIAELPWVERVRVVRRWPRGVEIAVVERTPIARIAIGPERLVVAEGGVVVGAASAVDDVLPLINVPGSTKASATGHLPAAEADAVAMVAAIPVTLRPRVKDATLADNGEVSVALTCGAVLQLGAPTVIAQKFLSAETILGGGVDLSGLKRLDVRVPADPRLERGGSCR